MKRLTLLNRYAIIKAIPQGSINAGGNTMFSMTLTDIQSILNDFSITEKPGSFSELRDTIMKIAAKTQRKSGLL